MKIEDIKHMSKEHLQNFAEYVARQKFVHVNCAPEGWNESNKLCWCTGWDDFGKKLEEMLIHPHRLVDHLPPREE